jgi:hypothetical protein
MLAVERAVCKVMDPNHPKGPSIDAKFPLDLVRRYYKYTPTTWWNLIAAKFVLEHPTRIFFGVREFQEGGWCYVAQPATWFVEVGIEAPFPAGKVFAVYLNPMMWVYE